MPFTKYIKWNEITSLKDDVGKDTFLKHYDINYTDDLVLYEGQLYRAHAYTAKLMTPGYLPTRSAYETMYLQFLNYPSNNGVVLVEPIYEKDSKGKLHTHATYLLPINKKNCRFTKKGIHTDLKRVTDLNGWRKYCEKAQKPVYDNRNYMFNNAKRWGSKTSQ